MALNENVYQDIDDRTETLCDLAEDYPDIWADFQRQFEFSWIYHENALEGITLTHAEIRTALQGRPIAPDTYGVIRDLKLAIDQVRKEAIHDGEKVDMARIRRFHALLGSSDLHFQPTRYRPDIPLHRTYFHEIAAPQQIPPRVARLLDWAKFNDPDDDNAVRFAAHFHHEFMSIFPFAEHTGKTGRLLINYILLRHGYLPVIFHATERQRYYDTLRLSKKDMENFLLDMMGNCVDNACTFIRKTVEERDRNERKARYAQSA